MLPVVSLMYGFLLRSVMSLDARKAQRNAARFLKGRFDPDHVFLSRDEEHLVNRALCVAACSDGSRSGAAPGPGAAGPVVWREWCWREPRTVGPCTFREVRWRFYANGRIAFQAEMENAAGSFRPGNLQGHRIELRAGDGCLLGAWRAAFFVRRSSGILHYPATILDEHPLVPLHFDELAERQDGVFTFA